MLKQVCAIAMLQVCAAAQVVMRVDAGSVIGPWSPVVRYFGYDEPNYTYMPNGKKLVGELAAATSAPAYFRTHSLLVTGDGTPALKWGSTNAYTEDAAGKPVYDWTIIDRIFDTYIQAKGKPLVEIGFMPEAMSVKPQPYKHNWAPGGAYGNIYTGWAYPPTDYAKWAELIHRWVLHCVDRYGREEVESWWWELWNEPDIAYWQGTPDEYNKLYDYTADAVKRALPTARMGGPGSTNPTSPKAAAFLRQFLEHCLRGKNNVTGKAGTPLDFISYHAKGAPQSVGDRIQMGAATQIANVGAGLEIVASYPGLARLPIIVSEWDPEGCAACSARLYPQNAYRNTTLYPSTTAVVLANSIKLADRYKVNLEGLLTWAFEFEGQPYFDGLRSLATNGIDKPVLNFFRMAGLMRGNRIRVTSDGALGLDEILKNGVREKPDIDGMATAGDHEISIMIWNYHDDSLPAPAASVRVALEGIPPAVARVLLKHYRIDDTHSNSNTVWKEMGSPQQPTADQYARMEAAGQLQLLESPRWVAAGKGAVRLDFSLPRHGISLLQLSW